MVQTNSIGQDITDVIDYNNRVAEARREYPVIELLEKYISKKYRIMSESDSKKESKRASDLAWKATKIHEHFLNTVISARTPEDNIARRHAIIHMQDILDKEDPLTITIGKVYQHCESYFDDIMSDYSEFTSLNCHLSEKRKKQISALIAYIRSIPMSGYREWRQAFADNSAGFFELSLASLIDIRQSQIGLSPEEIKRRQNSRMDELKKLPPHKIYEREFSTFLQLYHNFRRRIDNKIFTRQLTGKEYLHLTNETPEKIFYKIAEEAGCLT